MDKDIYRTWPRRAQALYGVLSASHLECRLSLDQVLESVDKFAKPSQYNPENVSWVDESVSIRNYLNSCLLGC